MKHFTSERTYSWAIHAMNVTMRSLPSSCFLLIVRRHCDCYRVNDTARIPQRSKQLTSTTVRYVPNKLEVGVFKCFMHQLSSDSRVVTQPPRLGTHSTQTLRLELSHYSLGFRTQLQTLTWWLNSELCLSDSSTAGGLESIITTYWNNYITLCT